MTVNNAKEILRAGKADALLTGLLEVPADRLSYYRERIERTLDNFAAHYGPERDVSVFSVGGRSEISGNHTDHNGGRVIAAPVNLDIIAVASPRDDGKIRVRSEGFDKEDVVKIDECGAPDPGSVFKSRALIAGMVHAFKARGYAVGGFDAFTTSDVIKGSGLSSSAAFEVMIGKILSYYYNVNNADPAEIAKSAQYAENIFFGKPCGLMDQMACAVGGLITVDFSSVADPAVKQIDFDFASSGISLCITNTGSSHSDLNDDYAAVPAEMKAVAKLFGKERLCELTEEDIDREAKKIRDALGDRALLRAYHFFEENKRVERQVECLERGDVDGFLALVSESGRSSFSYLQNVWSPSDVRHQATSLALLHTERFLSGRRGACRIQGGGFAGTIEAFIPSEDAISYKEMMEKFFGDGSCIVLTVRPVGGVKIL
ncbi:MAG: galactokinase [Clostridia bacterium]|nr:galactokinase [Clostridia bacterium]